MQARVALAVSDEARAKIEENERQRWVGALVELYKRVTAPVLVQASTTLNPEATLLRIAGGARAKTLRGRVRVWTRFTNWLRAILSNIVTIFVASILTPYQ